MLYIRTLGTAYKICVVPVMYSVATVTKNYIHDIVCVCV